MKKINNKLSIVFLSLLLMVSGAAYAQRPELQFFRSNDKKGLNVFETQKPTTLFLMDLKYASAAIFPCSSRAWTKAIARATWLNWAPISTCHLQT